MVGEKSPEDFMPACRVYVPEKMVWGDPSTQKATMDMANISTSGSFIVKRGVSQAGYNVRLPANIWHGMIRYVRS